MRPRARWGIAPLLAAPAGAWALGLGPMEMQSALNQPFRAEIELSATAEELEGLRVFLADADTFMASCPTAEAAGISATRQTPIIKEPRKDMAKSSPAKAAWLER